MENEVINQKNILSTISNTHEKVFIFPFRFITIFFKKLRPKTL
jgi:hypothetical protein